MDSLVNLAPILGGVGLVFAFVLYIGVIRTDCGTERMKEIAEAIQSGAMAFLRREYKGLIVALGVHGFLLDAIGPGVEKFYGGSSAILFLFEVGIAGLVLSSTARGVFRLYEGFSLPALTRWLRSSKSMRPSPSLSLPSFPQRLFKVTGFLLMATQTKRLGSLGISMVNPRPWK